MVATRWQHLLIGINSLATDFISKYIFLYIVYSCMTMLLLYYGYGDNKNS